MKFRTENFNSLMMVVLIALILGLSACSDENDEPKVPDTWTTAYTVTATFGPEMFEMVDITAHIAKPNGTVSEEVVLQEKYTLKMTGNNIPDKAGVLFTFVPKSNVDPDKVYHVLIDGNIRATSYKNGEVFSSLSPTSIKTSAPIKGSQVEKYFTGKGVAITVGISDDGNVTSVNPDQFDFGVNSVWEWLAGVLSGSDK
ncbi:MAG: hypothetical protein K2O49_00140 [Muribaculaceae bacterium]|nr:hypothetical protein [Muribaculaceae bacterium]